MRKLIKITISLLACLLMFLTGCGTPSASLPSELKAPNTHYPSTINILAPSFFSGPGDNVKQDKKRWLDEMSARYGVTFNIISNGHTDTGEFDDSATQQVFAMIESGASTYKGMFQIFDSGSDNGLLKNCIQNDAVVPLDDYLENNPSWNALPEDFKSIFKIDGDIYAIPTSFSQSQYARIIHNEALQETGITVTDLKSFHDFAVSYAQKTGNPVIGSTSVNSMIDILNAFGLYPGQSGPFSYDPTDGCYADWMTKGAAVDALEYLRELYQAGAIYLNYTEDYKKFESGIIASTYQTYSPYYDKCTEVTTLNPEHPQIPYTSRYGFAMTKDTPQPVETVNLLVNLLYGSEQNYLECRLGSPDNYILNSDGTITVKKVPGSEGKYVYPGMPNLAGDLPGIFTYSDADIFYSENGVVDMESKTDTGKYNAVLKQQYDTMKSGAVIQIPLSCQNMKSATYDANKWDVIRLYDKCFLKAIANKNTTVQQVVDEYKAAMLNMGGNTMLDEMNAGIDKKTAYYYG